MLASTCGVDIEIQSLNVANGGMYALTLPVGRFTLIASTEGEDTQVISLDITEGVNTTLDVTF